MVKEQLVIEKLLVDVYMNNKRSTDPSRVLLNLAEEMKSNVLPLLEKKLSESYEVKSDESIVIDSLTIDVHASNATGWQDQVAQKVADEIRTSERHVLEELQAKVGSHEVLNSKRSLFEAWVYFLKFGVLPNWKRELGIHSLKELLARLHDDSSEFARNMIPLLREDLQAFSRSLILLNENTLEKIIVRDDLIELSRMIRDFPSNKKEITSLKKALTQTLFDSFRKGEMLNPMGSQTHSQCKNGIKELQKISPELLAKHKRIIDQLTEVSAMDDDLTLIAEEVRAGAKEIVDLNLRFLINSLINNRKVSAAAKKTLHSFMLNENNASRTWSNFLRYFPAMLKSEADCVTVKSALGEMPAEIPEVIKERLNKELSESKFDKVGFKQQELETDDSLFIENAGLVLLKPFLPQLFANLNLLNKANNWNEAESQMEAMYILHFMITNTFEVTEDQLFLAKLLTGWDVNEPVEMPSTILGISTQNFEAIEAVLRKEQDDLLAFIRQNWRPMRNASWAGLQRDFLSRSGILTKTDERNYTLKVDEGALDVLLPHKNWGIGIIKYSWMECMINVEW